MFAGLRGDGGAVGALIVGNRLGVGGTFDEQDLRLFGTLAGHLGSALGQDHLARRVSALHEAQEQLYHQASHDSLTGLANRMLFMDRVQLALARRTGNAAVVYVDLDDFKPVNDTLGHEAGDRVLCVTADRLRASLRPADTPARLGGDEFAVLLTDIEPAGVRVVAERILRAFAEPFELAGREHAIRASIGIAIGEAGTDAAELMRNADAAMYVRKHGDKQGLSVYAA
jgi:diguanylate cyclase (GGDEF)-like protein